MIELLSTIKDTSTPALLVGGGLIFLVLAIAGSIRGQVAVPPQHQRIAGVIGVALLLAGIAIEIAPALRGPIAPSPTPLPALAGTHTPSIEAHTLSSPLPAQPPTLPPHPVTTAAPATEPPAPKILPTPAPTCEPPE